MPVLTSDTRIYPSITQQTTWPCRFFNFGKMQSPTVCYFNCGLVERPDGLWLVTRRSRNEKGVKIGFNDIMCFLLDANLTPIHAVQTKFHHFFDREHFEDPRAIYHRGITYISACNFVVLNGGRGWTGAHQVLNVIGRMESRNTWISNERIDPVYGNNGNTIGKDIGAEKNWLWFFHQDNLYMVYSTDPHIVCRFSPGGVFEQEYKTENPKPLDWKYGTIRGGTPPAMTKDGAEYVSFFHSSLPDDTYHRRYYMGAYAFESQPPFRITRYTPDPLLAGSPQDIWFKGKPLVVFPCGSRLRDEKWLVTMGINDLASAWIEIPHDDLQKRMVDVYTPPNKKRFFFDGNGGLQTSPCSSLRIETPDWRSIRSKYRRPTQDLTP